ncbi:MAG TPA: hypothetical protein VIU64_17560 [Polyangia bacterium]
MTNREIDCLVMGLAAGGTTCLWLGYKLRQRVERWQAGRARRARRGAKPTLVPIPDVVVGINQRPEQSARRVLVARNRVIPLTPKRHVVYTDVAGDPTKVAPAPIPIAPLSREGAEEIAALWRGAWPDVARISDTKMRELEDSAVRRDAVAALTGAGYKRAAAEAAVDACSPEERAGGLESWVAAAFRRASAKP